MHAKLEIINGNKAGSVVTVSGSLIIGRRGDAGLSLDDPGISWNHARIEPNGNELWVADLGSANGTFLDGKRVPKTWVFLPPGAELRFANIKCKVRVEDRAVAAAPDPLAKPPESARLRQHEPRDENDPPTIQMRPLSDSDFPTYRAPDTLRFKDQHPPRVTPLPSNRTPTPHSKTPMVNSFGTDSNRIGSLPEPHDPTCRSCGHSNPPHVTFCMQCGVALTGAVQPKVTASPPKPAVEDDPSALTGRNTVQVKNPYAPFLGRTINGYRIERKLGHGAYGMVFEARQVKLKRNVAIKVLPPVLSHDRAVISRFETEAQAVARIEHPNIVSVFDMFQAEGLFCIAMAHVEGGSVRDLIKKEGQLTEPLAARLAYETALGLWAAFEKGVVHRDIKPENLLLNRKGRIKIVDFGLAKAAELSTGLTVSGAFMGTPAYMSPEQWRDSHESDHRSDLYSLGVTLFQILAGRVPFEGPTTPAYVEQHVLQDPPRIKDLREDVSDEMARIVHRLLEKNPDERFQTGAEVAEALKPLMEELPISGVGKPIAPKKKIPSQKVPRVAKEPRPEPPADAAAVASGKGGTPLVLVLLLLLIGGGGGIAWWVSDPAPTGAQGIIYPANLSWLKTRSVDVQVQAGDFDAENVFVNGQRARSGSQSGLFIALVQLEEGERKVLECVMRASDGSEQKLLVLVNVDFTAPEVEVEVEAADGHLLLKITSNEPLTEVACGEAVSRELAREHTLTVPTAESLTVVAFDRAGNRWSDVVRP